ncbi:MAG: hypothetical protein RBU27_13990 [Bacteroidota bacterium]|jgi:hypothetical protein|nr:hypothetical protein [Bacteroidota bacterium]
MSRIFIPVVLVLALAIAPISFSEASGRLIPRAKAALEEPVADFAIIIFKYDARVNVWQRAEGSDTYDVVATGSIYRSFPTGPKTAVGDERIPEGVYHADIDAEGNITLRFEMFPDMHEHYRITGASLDRNVIALRGEAFDIVRAAAREMFAAGARRIPLVILPGTLEREVVEKLGRARRVREGQTLADVERSVRRWKPVEDYIIATGRIPLLRFDGADIEILDQSSVRNADGRRSSLADDVQR